MTVNQAKFTISGTPSEDPVTGDRLYQATVGEVLTLTLEVSPSSVLGATYYVYDPTVPDSPLASMDAPLLTFVGSGTSSDSPTSPNGSVTIAMPGAAAHSYNIRCIVSTVAGQEEFVRQAAVPYTLGAQTIVKTTPEETIEYFARTWSDKFNEYLDYIALFTLVGLDDAYDKGGAGLGRTITADVGAVEITGSNAADYTLEVTNSDNGGVLYINNAGTGLTVDIQDGGANVFQIADGGAFDLDASTFSLDGTIISIDASDNSNITLASNTVTDEVLTINVTNAGAGFNDIDMDADGGIYIDAGRDGIKIGVTIGAVIIGNGVSSVTVNADLATYNSTADTEINAGGQIYIGNDAVAQPIGIGTGNSARTITIGHAGFASTEVEITAIRVDINADSNGVQIDSAAGISLDAHSVSNYSVNGSGQHLTLECFGGGLQKLSLGSAGTGVDAIDISASAGGVEIDAVKASHFIVSGATADLTFNARAGTAITLNELGQVALDASFTATSMIGAFNELKNGPLWMSGTTIDAATPAYTINAGDEYMVLHVDRTTAGACAITFQSAWIAIDGNVICIKDTGRNSFVNNVTIVTQAAELFEGDAAGGRMKSNGACWWIKTYGGNLYMI